MLRVPGWVVVLLVVSLAPRAVAGSWVTYSSGEETGRGYLAVPEGAGPFPALILIQGAEGRTDWMRENADRFARNGYVALAVDLVQGAGATDQDTAPEPARALPVDRGRRDVEAAFAYLASRDDVARMRIGVIGWGRGGAYALQAAQRLPDLAACVVVYGRPTTEMAALVPIRCPVLGIFGSRDPAIPVPTVRTFERNMRDLGKVVEIHFITGVGSGFMDPRNRAGYDAAAADRAWRRIFRFLDRFLRRGG